jgi:AAHS family 4-hydroxybenzoate transporter-like MFS transporter
MSRFKIITNPKAKQDRGENVGQQHSINVRSFIDERPVGRHQIVILALIVLVIALDGMDIGIMGFAAPEIIRTWGITKAEMGTVLSSVFIGMAAGAALTGPMGDRFGRKLVIVGSVFWFGLLTLLAARATGVPGLLVLRTLAGVGLGAAFPSAYALLAEYAPQPKRSLILTIAISGFTGGATIAGFLAAWLIPSFGWKVTLAATGLLPVVFAGALMFLLPESVAFLALKRRTDMIPAILRKIDPRVVFTDGSTFWLPLAADEPKGSIAILLLPRYIVTVAMLCVAYFMECLVTYIIVGWLPVITREAGFGLAEGAIITSIFTLAGPVGSICVGAAMDRMSAHKLLVTTTTISAIFLACVGIAPKGFAELSIFMLALGFFFHGSTTGLHALSAQSFPTSARATGVSWMHTAGRVGAIGSGMLGGLLLSWGWTFGQIFLALAAPMLIAALALAIMGIRASKVGPIAPVAGDLNEQSGRASSLAI